MKYSIEELEKKVYQYRKRFLEIFTSIGFGHVTSAFSWAEIAAVLYNEIMVLPEDIEKMDCCDKIVVSKGHGAGILYPIFEDLGYFTREQMENMVCVGGDNRELRKLILPGFDFYGGSLGMGLGLAAGLAKGYQLNGKKQRVYCILGDAECYEGSIWEAVNFAGHQKLSHLIVIVDRNELGCSDFTEHMLRIEPLKEKWQSCSWEVYEVNGHDISAVYGILDRIVSNPHEKPQCIIAKTKKGKGLDYLVDRPLMHGYMPQDEDIKKAFAELK